MIGPITSASKTTTSPRDENGEFMRYDSPADSLADDIVAMSTLIPTHIVFNGVTGALQGDGALTANVGESVLIVHSQANRQSYPHLIGDTETTCGSEARSAARPKLTWKPG